MIRKAIIVEREGQQHVEFDCDDQFGIQELCVEQVGSFIVLYPEGVDPKYMDHLYNEFECITDYGPIH